MFRKSDVSWLFSFWKPALTCQLVTSRQLWWHPSSPFSFSKHFLYFWGAFSIAALRHLPWILSSLSPFPLVSLLLMNRALFILFCRPLPYRIFFLSQWWWVHHVFSTLRLLWFFPCFVPFKQSFLPQECLKHSCRCSLHLILRHKGPKMSSQHSRTGVPVLRLRQGPQVLDPAAISRNTIQAPLALPYLT